MSRLIEKLKMRPLGPTAFALAMASGLMALGMLPAQAAPVASCPLVIKSCGCVITTSDTYTVAKNLNASQTRRPNCIEIQADHAILNLKGNSVTGDGSDGIGILIRSGADHAVVEGGDEGAAPPADDAGTNGKAFPNAQGVVTQWNIGIEDDADDAVIGLFKNIGGNIFQQHGGNKTAGIYLNGVKHSVAMNFQASYNGQDGVKVSNSARVSLSNFTTAGNTRAGVSFNSSNNDTIATVTVANNGKYGFWLLSSKGNLITDANGTANNGRVGILLGCGPEPGCSATGSNNNRITNSGASGSSGAGILIDKGNSQNIVTLTHNAGNPKNRDMVDNNPQCDSNIWYNNTGSGNRKCIH
jgi:Right handed beta helix region